MTELFLGKKTPEKVISQIATIQYMERELFYKIDKYNMLPDRHKEQADGLQLNNEIKILQHKYCSTKIDY